MKKALLVMAAGMGSRFGGLKQIEPVGPNGEFIIDYTIYDAIRSGFDKVVFIIKEENYEIFKNTIGKRVQEHIETSYVFQRLDDILEGYDLGEREKPLGTAHAIYAARSVIDNNFALINADDFYGYNAIKKVADFLNQDLLLDKEQYALIGYKVKNTITLSGSVKRGICNIENNKLVSLEESKIEITDNGFLATNLHTNMTKTIDGDTLVSMNLLGFPKEFIKHIEEEFPVFLNESNLENDEFLMPDVLTKQIMNNKAEVHIIETDDKWYGMTYKDDKEIVVNAIKDMIDKGIYKCNLWD